MIETEQFDTTIEYLNKISDKKLLEIFFELRNNNSFDNESEVRKLINLHKLKKTDNKFIVYIIDLFHLVSIEIASRFEKSIKKRS